MENMEPKESIKNCLIVIVKEAMKFALVGVLLFFMVVQLSIYIFIEILKINGEMIGKIILKRVSMKYGKQRTN